jgi:hypothetical protein
LTGVLGLAVGSSRLCSADFWQQQQHVCLGGASFFSDGSCFPQHGPGAKTQHHPDGDATRMLHSNASERVIMPIGAMVNRPKQKGKLNSYL